MSSSLFIQTLTTLRPAAVAKIQGDMANPVRGYATFYNTYTGDFPPLSVQSGIPELKLPLLYFDIYYF